MISDMHNDKRRNKIVPDLFIRGGKINISLAFIMQSHLKHVLLDNTCFLQWQFQIKENLKKLRIVIYDILTLKAF